MFFWGGPRFHTGFIPRFHTPPFLSGFIPGFIPWFHTLVSYIGFAPWFHTLVSYQCSCHSFVGCDDKESNSVGNAVVSYWLHTSFISVFIPVSYRFHTGFIPVSYRLAPVPSNAAAIALWAVTTKKQIVRVMRWFHNGFIPVSYLVSYRFHAGFIPDSYRLAPLPSNAADIAL